MENAQSLDARAQLAQMEAEMEAARKIQVVFWNIFKTALNKWKTL